jgi:magnesium chelatase family protein
MTSAEARVRVAAARAAASDRLAATQWSLNSEVPGSFLRGPGMRLGQSTTASIDRALERGGITMRGYDRVLRVGWTIADLAGATVPTAEHIGQALYLRKAMAA